MCDLSKRLCTGVIHLWWLYSQQLDNCHLLFVNQSRGRQLTANKVGHQKDEGDINFDSRVITEAEKMWLTEWLTPHITTLSRGSLARNSFTFCATKCFFLVFVLLAMDAAMLLAEAIFQLTNQLLSCAWKSWQNVLPWSHQLTIQQRRCNSFSLRAKKCPSSFLHATVTQARSPTHPDLDK